MDRGKKSKAYQIVYGALEESAKKLGKEPVEILTKALDNVKPVFEVKSRRVGGATYQVPIEVRDERREALGMRWLIQYARGRTGADMRRRLSAELSDAFNNTGNAVKKKEDTHKMAEANKAFAHYRW
jgi:small subunit ribosomal protein S7